MPSVRGSGLGHTRAGFRMPWRARYIVFGGIAIATVVGLISWHLFGGRRDVLKPDGGPVVTVMDFGQSFPLDPLPSGWWHRKFWTRSPMTMAFAVKEGVPSMRFETHDSVDVVSACRYRPRRLPDAGMAVVHRIADPQSARRTHRNSAGQRSAQDAITSSYAAVRSPSNP
jgi:hypothetical protein